MKKIIVFSLLALLPFFAAAHGGVEQVIGNYVVTLNQQPISPLVGENVQLNFALADTKFRPVSNTDVQLKVIDTALNNPAQDQAVLTQGEKTDNNGDFSFNYTFPKENFYDIHLDFNDPQTGKPLETGFLIQPRAATENSSTNKKSGRYSDLALLFLRLIVAAIFLESGRRDLQKPAERGQSMGMSKIFTIFLGLAEVAGGLGIVFGVLTQLAAIGLILIMLGAIQKKAMVWKTGFWGQSGIGWHYELMIALILLEIMATHGGNLVLLHKF